MEDLEQQDLGGVEVNEIESAGVITDSQGHSWTIPADENEDFDDLSKTGIFSLLKHDPRFAYELKRRDEVAQCILTGWVVVTKEEVGLPADLVMEFGKPVTTEFAFVDGVYMKIPKILHDRRQARKVKVAKEVVDQTEPTEAMLERARRNGTPVMKSLREAMDAAKAQGGATAQDRKTRVSDKLTR